MSMNVNQNQGQDPDQQGQYGGYGGYTGTSGGGTAGQANDPYGSSQYGQYDQQYGQGQQQQQQYTYGQGQQQQQQQYETYQPPLSARRGATPQDPTSTGMKAGTEAVLSYLLGWITGLVFLVIERKNSFVRFSAAQSTLFFGSVTVVLVVIKLLVSIPFLGFLLGIILNPVSWLIGVVAFVVWLFLMVQAYRGVKVRLPYFGNLAERWVGRK